MFVQKFGGDSNYANKTSINARRLNTGRAGDKKCNVHDISSNCAQWSTEHCTRANYPCVARGGRSGTTSFSAVRSIDLTSVKDVTYSFRPILYIK